MKVKPCWPAKINGVKCLESDDEIGYFKSENDRRPSSCRWVKKNKIKASTQSRLI
jgi:hypothetical protein